MIDMPQVHGEYDPHFTRQREIFGKISRMKKMWVLRQERWSMDTRSSKRKQHKNILADLDNEKGLGTL
jgi:hypothetical protein